MGENSDAQILFQRAPNPNKVALFLESGLPTSRCRRHPQGRPVQAGILVNPNGKVPAIDDDGVFVFDSNAILLYLAEKTGKFLPADTPPTARNAVMADVRRDRRRSLFRPGRAFQAFRAERPGICAQPLPVRGAAPLRILNDHLANSRYMVGDTYTIVDMASGAGRAWRRSCRR